MSILEQLKQSRVRAPAEAVFQRDGPNATASIEATTEPEDAAPGQTLFSEELEWTSSESRAARLQAERSGAYNDLKSRIHEDLIGELDPEQLSGDTSLNSPIRRAVENTAEER